MFDKKYTDLINIPSGSVVIVGLSGGPDSIFLLRLLAATQHEKQLIIIAVHLDHQWRTESAHDAQFCQRLCKDLNITLIEGQASNITLNRPTSGSQEDLGRQLRRHFFEKVAQEHNAQYIALGHHADDQTETFLIRIIRGATLAGLTGIKKQNGLYWRPLLKLSKLEILEWLDQNNIEYLTDPTNASSDFLRNRIRSTVIPALKDSDSRFDANFARTLEHLQETEQFLVEMTQNYFNAVVDHNLSLDIHKLKNLPPFLQKRIIVDWLYKNKVQVSVSDKLIKEVIRFFNHERGGLHQVHTTCGMEKKQNKANIKPL